MSRIQDWIIFGLGFRVFFLFTGLAGVGLMVAWIGLLSFGPWPGAPVDPVAWHAHEMVFGFAGAAIAGFLLTAVPKWVADPGSGGRPSTPSGSSTLPVQALCPGLP
ncbi:MAG: NnrS family protein [Proteobacteria bacterium]|nr:NnrS family protein [Pseudomonadota bacterium]